MPRVSIFVLTCLMLWFSSVSYAGQKWKIFASTYPIYQFTKIVTEGEKGVEVDLLLPASTGCPHDYALSPQDMKKIASADVLVINGLSMEEFLGAPIRQVNSKLAIVDSSAGIANLLEFSNEDEAEDGDEHGHHEQHQEHHAHHNHDPKAEHKHEHRGVNPHLFASPKMAAELAVNIASALSNLRPESSEKFKENAKQFASKMERLTSDFENMVKALKNNRIITEHGVFDYLARDMGLKVVAVIQAHAGHEPSAAQMMSLVKTVKEKKVGAVFTEPQYSPKVAQTIGKEAKIPVATLDPVSSGPFPVGSDYYEKIMRKNMKTLEKTLGRQ